MHRVLIDLSRHGFQFVFFVFYSQSKMCEVERKQNKHYT